MAIVSNTPLKLTWLPGISWSRPASTVVPWVAHQSDWTKPRNPILSRRIVVSICLLEHAYSPSALLYPHITADAPASMAAWKGGKYNSQAVFSSTTELSVWRLVSCSLKPQCLTDVINPRELTPATYASDRREPRYGSSPDKYSKFRPFRATRCTCTDGPRTRVAPFAANSSAMAMAKRRTRFVSHVAAIAKAEGQQVTVPTSSLHMVRTPPAAS
mmetsp:Transcript_44878/g.124362  ORF Transcript_44878/g.124362 Transcript_44878/m.124362 type:complete len:215 (+) Transcript_44878:250-894(+)